MTESNENYAKTHGKKVFCNAKQILIVKHKLSLFFSFCSFFFIWGCTWRGHIFMRLYFISMTVNMIFPPLFIYTGKTKTKTKKQGNLHEKVSSGKN